MIIEEIEEMDVIAGVDVTEDSVTKTNVTKILQQY